MKLIDFRTSLFSITIILIVVIAGLSYDTVNLYENLDSILEDLHQSGVHTDMVL